MNEYEVVMATYTTIRVKADNEEDAKSIAENRMYNVSVFQVDNPFVAVHAIKRG